MLVVSSAHRPVIDGGWIDGIREYANHRPDSVLNVSDAGSFVVDLVQNSELRSIAIPPFVDRAEVESRVEAGMPATFGAEMGRVATRGMTYQQRKGKPGMLMVKLAADQRLVAENEAVFDIFSRYGMTPHGHQMFFSIILGSAMVGHLDGDAKVRLRLDLTDLTPPYVKLDSGLIRIIYEDINPAAG